MTNATESKKTGYVKYWNHEEPITLKTEKNEIRFFPQHEKVQVYPVISSGRGIGKGATLNLDAFTSDQLETFYNNLQQVLSNEEYLDERKYWDHEDPVTMDTDKNEVRFYQEHGKIQVYPRIESGRGIGKGATINLVGIGNSQLAILKENFKQIMNKKKALSNIDFNAPVNERTPPPHTTEKVSTEKLKEMFGDIVPVKHENAFSEEDVMEILLEVIMKNEFKTAIDKGIQNGADASMLAALLELKFGDSNHTINHEEVDILTNQVQFIVTQKGTDNMFIVTYLEFASTYIEGVNPSPLPSTEEEEEYVEEEPDEVEEEIEKEEELEEPEEIEEDEPTNQSQNFVESEELPTTDNEDLSGLDEDEVMERDMENEIYNETVEKIGTNIHKLTDSALKKLYLENTSIDLVEFNPEFTVSLFEEMKKRNL